MQQKLERKIESYLNPSHLIITDNSAAHIGHAGSPDGKGTHFNIIVVASCFEGKNSLQRHRLVFDAIKPEFELGLHALSIKTLTAEEYAEHKS